MYILLTCRQGPTLSKPVTIKTIPWCITLTVTDYEGNYVFDILMFPLHKEVEEFPDEDIGNVTYDVEDNILPGFDLTYTAVALLLLMIMGAAAYYHYKRKDGV